MRKIESLGKGSTLLSSFRSSLAATQQVLLLPCDVVGDGEVGELAIWLGLTRVGVIDSTTPTLVPPIRTSLFLTRREPFGTTTETR